VEGKENSGETATVKNKHLIGETRGKTASLSLQWGSRKKKKKKKIQSGGGGGGGRAGGGGNAVHGEEGIIQEIQVPMSQISKQQGKTGALHALESLSCSAIMVED